MTNEIKNLLQEMEYIEPSRILSLMGITLEKKRGSNDNFTCTCPFPMHMDSNSGNFHVSDSRRLAKCFACGLGGRPVRFFRDLCSYNSDYVAGIRLAELVGRITHDEAEKLLSGSREQKKYIAKNVIANKSKCFEKKQNDTVVNKQPVDVLNLFYNTFAANLGLTEYDKEYLLGRGVKEDDLSLFASISDYEYVAKAFVDTNTILKWGFDKYIGIPGIYAKNNNGETKILLNCNTKKGSSILIKIIDIDGKTVGLQQRLSSNNDKGKRYFWLSSANVFGDAYGGVSSGAPVGFYPTLTPEKSPIAITEGVFKALSLKDFGVSAFSVQGVSNWRGIVDSLNIFFDKYKNHKRKVFMAFDMDFKTNVSVLEQMEKLYDKLLENYYEVSFFDWNESYKGIDDALFNNQKIVAIKGSSYASKFFAKKIYEIKNMHIINHV